MVFFSLITPRRRVRSLCSFKLIALGMHNVAIKEIVTRPCEWFNCRLIELPGGVKIINYERELLRKIGLIFEYMELCTWDIKISLNWSCPSDKAKKTNNRDYCSRYHRNVRDTEDDWSYLEYRSPGRPIQRQADWSRGRSRGENTIKYEMVEFMTVAVASCRLQRVL